MTSTRWDARVLARSAAVAGLTLGLAWLVTLATDEGSILWGERAGRSLPLTPACAAIGAWAALAPVQAGPRTAAAADGVRLTRAQMTSAVAGGTLVAWVAAVIIAVAPTVTVTAFFPRAARTSAWVWQDGAFVDRAQGLRVGADGVPTFLAARSDEPLPAIPREGRAAVSIATALAGLALPLLVSHALLVRSVAPKGDSHARRGAYAGLVAVLAAGGALTGSAVLFQAAAAWNLSALLGAAPSALLLAFALGRYRASS